MANEAERLVDFLLFFLPIFPFPHCRCSAQQRLGILEPSSEAPPTAEFLQSAACSLHSEAAEDVRENFRRSKQASRILRAHSRGTRSVLPSRPFQLRAWTVCDCLWLPRLLVGISHPLGSLFVARSPPCLPIDSEPITQTGLSDRGEPPCEQDYKDRRSSGLE